MTGRCFRGTGLTKCRCEVMTIACEIPIWHKSNLTLEEAASYFNIGINKLRQMTDSKACEKYVLWVGNRRLIKRIPFESYLQSEYSI